jgi:hypothetical protein
MLKIRPENLRAFQPQAEAAAADRIAEHIRKEHADCVVDLPGGVFTVRQIPDEQLREMVRNGIARARRHGMSTEASLASFVVLMFVVAPNFDDHPLIERVLKDEAAPPDSRIALLWERTSEQNWDAAKENYDAGAWNLKA